MKKIVLTMFLLMSLMIHGQNSKSVLFEPNLLTINEAMNSKDLVKETTKDKFYVTNNRLTIYPEGKTQSFSLGLSFNGKMEKDGAIAYVYDTNSKKFKSVTVMYNAGRIIAVVMIMENTSDNKYYCYNYVKL